MAAGANQKEVITIQVGNYSNFVGSHFWNLQEALLHDGNVDEGASEVNNNILYREGQNLSGKKTFKPRVICMDLKDNVSRLQECDDVSDGLEGNAWEGPIERYDRGEVTNDNSVREMGERDNRNNRTTKEDCQNVPEKFQKLEDHNVSWLDYSLVRFHARSLQLIQNSHLSESKGFANFGEGESLFRNQKFRDDFEDRLHFFAEECDRLQGFQIFTDIHNSFGGLTSGILEEMAEEYAKKSHLCFATMPAAFADDTRSAVDKRILNILLEFAKYGDTSSLTLPISLRNSFSSKGTSVTLPWIDYKESVDYHSSAILATAIDTATLSYRFTHLQATDMRTLTGNLSSGGRKLAIMSAGIPVPISSTFTLMDLIKENGYVNYTSLTPDVGKPENILSQSTMIRGIPMHLLKKNDYTRTTQQILKSGVKRRYFPNSHSCHIAQQPCMLTPLFPDVFKRSVTPVGCVVKDYQRPQEQAVQKTSAMTSLQSCEEVSNLLDVLVTGAKRANIKKHPEFMEGGVEEHDIESALESLTVLSQCYHYRYEL